MRRRELVEVLGAAATLLPLGATAQPGDRLRRVGVLMPFPADDPISRAIATAFAQALGRLGWMAGRNLRIDYRFAADDPARLGVYAGELVALSPDALVAAIPPAVTALRQRTRTIPIVFEFVADPVGQGFVRSLARPGGNITGLASFDPPMLAKWLQLMKEAAPGLARIAIVFDPDTAPFAPLLNRSIAAAARSLGVAPKAVPVHDDDEIARAASAEARAPGGGLVALPDSFTTAHRAAIIAAAARHRLPLIGPTELFPRDGALMSYFVDPLDVQAEAASYVDRILKGAKAADLPVQYPTKFKLVINLKTAKALGLSVPPLLLAEADEVIQ